MGVTSMFCPGNCPGRMRMGSCSGWGTWMGFCLGIMDGVLPGHMDGVLPGHMDGVLRSTWMGFCLHGHMDGVLPGHMDGVLLGHLDGHLSGWVLAPAWGRCSIYVWAKLIEASKIP